MRPQTKVMKKISIIEKLSKSLFRHSFVTIDNTLARLYRDYGYVIYDQPNNENFTQKIEKCNEMITL